MAANHGTPSLQVAMEEIISLRKKVSTMENERAEQNLESNDESLVESQPLRQSLWDSKVPYNFKSPHLPTFDDPVEHLMAVGTQTAIIGAPEHLRCKLLSGTLKDDALRTKHIKVTTTSLFTIRQNYTETLREYLARFSEATITVSNPNQEMFVAAFHNGLKAGHFNERATQKSAPETPNKRIQGTTVARGKVRNPNATGKATILTNRDIVLSPITLLMLVEDQVTHSTGLAPLPPPRMHNTIMGPDTEAWCAYHRCKGHDTERCFRLRDLIEDLIRSGHLRKFLEDAAKGKVAIPKQIPNQQKGEGDSRNKGEKHRVAVNTISGGFAGGGESNSARKRYVRRSRFEVCSVGSSTFPHTPDISFNPEDARDVIPHDDDPLVIQVHILNCDVKRVLIDSGSSADILYWNAYKAMRLSDEQLNPYSGTLVRFSSEQVDVVTPKPEFT
ncbi:hypothetical protein TSUD_410820 [Trifolium subterraneum]|uniref:Retrotransposon gag domain-containing protein n=1 Tax=Trifolium subterraneum TaxID=3900 RepID=A0A2Z6P521_TRISU|nr:hypothetical protein TSUD_410820 [Trifolium subterraneum]